MSRTVALVLVFALAAIAAAQTPNRPQTPQPPFNYTSRDVQFVNPSDGTRLAGTLTAPKGQDRFAAVVLAPGAGAVDRDNTMMGHKPFLVLADFLAKQGIAALRLDSRGIGGSSGDYRQATGDHLASDLVAAVEYLSRQPEINPKSIGLAGHSQGGLVSAIAAAQSRQVRFLILLAAPGIGDTELLLQRIQAAGRRRGLEAAAIEEQQGAFREARARMFRGEMDDRIKTAFSNTVRLMLPASMELPAPALAAAVDQQIAASREPNSRFFLSLEPRTVYSRITCPVLAANGTRDQNVPSEPNLAAIEKAMAEGRKPEAKFVPVEGLNHFFQTAQTGAPMEAAQLEETLSPRLLEMLASWLKSHT